MRVAFIVTAALLLVPLASASGGPRIRLADRAPATVSGSGFHVTERIAVTVTNGKLVLSKRVYTNAHGVFTARFLRDIPMPACGQIAIRALGADGERAAWKTPPQVCGAEPPSDQ
jgi:hypothetical protein